jgi:uncharacterized protein YuzE
MKISYDPEVDALSPATAGFREITVTTKRLAEGIAADYNSEGRLAGLEILDAQKRFGELRPCAVSSSKASAPDSLVLSTINSVKERCSHGALRSQPPSP